MDAKSEAAEMPPEEFMELASEIQLTWIDLTPIAAALQAEYQRGVADGAKQLDTAQLEAAAYERGRAEMRAEIIKGLIGGGGSSKPSQGFPLDMKLGAGGGTNTHVAVLPHPLAPEGRSEKALPAIPPEPEPEPDAVVIEEIPKIPSKDDLDEMAAKIAPPGTVHPHARPEGIPSTFQMFQIILREKPGQLTSRELIAEVASRWWPGLKFDRLAPEISTSVTKGRVHRDLDGKLTLTAKGDKIDATDNRGMARLGTQPPQPKQALVPKRRDDRRLFVVGGGKPPIPLLPAEWSFADALHKAMGKGFVDVAFLAVKVWGHSRGSDNQARLAGIMATLNPSLAEIGLRTEYHKGFGYVMKEIDG